MAIMVSYLVTCLTENLRITTPYSDNVPTTCPHDTAHTIDPNQTKVYRVITPENVTVYEKSDGYYQGTSLCYEIPASEFAHTMTTSHDVSWPSDIYITSTWIYCDAASAGDSLNIICAPDTLIGTLTSPAHVDDQIITVSSTVLQNSQVGLDLTLSDGVNRNELGRITAVDVIGSTMTFEKALTNNFSIGTGLLLNIHVIRNFVICPNMLIVNNGICFGNRPLNGKTLPANTIMRIVYTNTSNTTKHLSCRMEYMILPIKT